MFRNALRPASDSAVSRARGDNTRILGRHQTNAPDEDFFDPKEDDFSTDSVLRSTADEIYSGGQGDCPGA